MLKIINQLPIDSPSFSWKKTTPGKDVKVNEWIQSIHHLDKDEKQNDWDIVLMGVPLSRSSISASGASEFPEWFRRSWKGFNTYNLDEELDLRDLKVIDIGDVQMHYTDILLSHQYIKDAFHGVTKELAHSFPVTIGGDHSITAMLVKGLKETYPNEEIGILQLDTHFDLRDLKDHGPTNGTPIRNLIESGTIKGENVYNIGLHGFFNAPSLVEYAKEYGVNYITLTKARRNGIRETVEEALQVLAKKVDRIYLTVDMDVLDIAYAPGVPASTPGGMRTDELFEAVFAAGLHPKVGAMDIVCLDPTRDGTVQPTVKAGTHVFLSFLSGFYKRKK
ncbi:agmatinase family protein [Heyndrickxia sporothermodurans]|uniref:Agmatinase family protein n=1 Tax=Heyndrickxia sporothermodurans TaxID=46224 RepID=A0A150L8B7_9BACI|nr:agmatinase family protein [Heyndrickxia sporothermodurans]KYD08593.1 Formiminoglutamase [Heyndrickxia sporothermodurans]MBL5766907.1 agmatinase family protein [Heyndrickxia sporothermodurans]MBL5771553.1 agmatinase family protein [Heyndrickxia sporothermodurans]MBL5773885.1 agmatinase family protein [Heyndrickxia sporothermodurans]MBL5778284.1 agmatinase family protein [Heyndrickxia sporothermodurans]